MLVVSDLLIGIPRLPKTTGSTRGVLSFQESGLICFDRLLYFISNALDTERQPPRFRTANSMEEECFNLLEWQLSKDFSALAKDGKGGKGQGVMMRFGLICFGVWKGKMIS